MLRITTLSENTAGAGQLLAEWGLSVLVETDTAKVLLDTGQGISTAYNAGILGIDLAQIDKIVLSHGHYDHTGGLRDILRRIRKPVEVITHHDAWAGKYVRRQGDDKAYIGIPYNQSELESLGAKFTLMATPVPVTGDMMTTGEIPITVDFEAIEPDRFFVKQGRKWQPDTFTDDQALIIKTEQGLVVILGCGHRGLVNTLNHAQQLTGIKKIHMVLGGCHLLGASEERLWMTISALKDFDVERIGMSHCTGMVAATAMMQEFSNRFFFNNAGTRVELP